MRGCARCWCCSDLCLSSVHMSAGGEPEPSQSTGEGAGATRCRSKREDCSLAIGDPWLRARYAERQTEPREAMGRVLEERARHLGSAELPTPARDVVLTADEHHRRTLP